MDIVIRPYLILLFISHWWQVFLIGYIWTSLCSSNDYDTSKYVCSLNLEQGGHVYEPDGSATLLVDPGASFSLHFSLQDSHPELELMAQNCVATPTSDISDPNLQYSLIENGWII